MSFHLLWRSLRHQRKQKKAISADGKKEKTVLYKKRMYKDSHGGERFGRDFSPVQVTGVSTAKLMARWLQIQRARWFTASAARKSLFPLLANHCLNLIFRNAVGFHPFLTDRQRQGNPCPCAALSQHKQHRLCSLPMHSRLGDEHTSSFPTAP